MANKIVGRSEECTLLQSVCEQKEAQFIALYGRRRVGKTHLIREFFNKKGVYIEVTGRHKGNIKIQLRNFTDAVSSVFDSAFQDAVPNSWHEALEEFTRMLEVLPVNKKCFLFLDELPWLVTKKSELLEEIDHYWNTRWSRHPNFILITCGSAASWMLEKLVHAKGGLHNRITQTILLQPFNLKQSQQYLSTRGIKLGMKQVLDLYMVMGGIPFYLNQVLKSRSIAQNINHICFTKNGLLFNEFESLFGALFKQPETSLSIIREISKRTYGISRNELLKATKLKSGGRFKQRIKELEASGFIQSYIPYQKKLKDVCYRLVDPYTLFYLRWIEKLYSTGRDTTDPNYWYKKTNTGEWNAWCGYAFENVCLKHVTQIAKALDITHVGYDTSSWQYRPAPQLKETGAQIDLLFDRSDHTVNICEIKYSHNKYTIDKNYAKNLANKLTVFESRCHVKKEIQLSMITTSGIKQNIWSIDLVNQTVTLSDLFE